MTHTPNDLTLQSYEEHAQAYIDHTLPELNDGLKAWYQTLLQDVPANASIFEIGSASGRDAKFIETLGYTVTRSDATRAFLEIMKKDGYEATYFNALTDDFPANLDVVIANAVLLHFEREAACMVMHKVYAALRPSGLFALTVMQGDRDYTSDETDAKIGAPRYFCFWKVDTLEHALREAGFSSVTIQEARGGTWLNAVARA